MYRPAHKAAKKAMQLMSTPGITSPKKGVIRIRSPIRHSHPSLPSRKETFLKGMETVLSAFEARRFVGPCEDWCTALASKNGSPIGNWCILSFSDADIKRAQEEEVDATKLHIRTPDFVCPPATQLILIWLRFWTAMLLGARTKTRMPPRIPRAIAVWNIWLKNRCSDYRSELPNCSVGSRHLPCISFQFSFHSSPPPPHRAGISPSKLRDPHLRREVLLQCLIVFDYLRRPKPKHSKTKIAPIAPQFLVCSGYHQC